MECNPELVSAFLDGELEPVIRDAFIEHLLVCPECQILLAALGQLKGYMSGSCALDNPEDLTQRIMMTIHNGDTQAVVESGRGELPKTHSPKESFSETKPQAGLNRRR
ncbi:putative transmembrane anti-sigma factor [Magnetococcus marinus MC-1]|uniref:Putative transmembrane anti-sigma factor n=1 Tax=Magnetococcus marinus (strain ATCC BAA-1437 / JCM 17883 / MC-1) TaxID=156889 RepID=A0L8L9_MAGMM|nr:anti-sigma factor [Magnetococcus marinus]ABK44312.1 putative transmembrane anti-sigma factor [Magnetococcus marinus MC-1]